MDYNGTYQHPFHGLFTVKAVPNQNLLVQFNEFYGELKWVQEDSFTLISSDYWKMLMSEEVTITFERISRGGSTIVVGLLYPMEDSVPAIRFVKQDLSGCLSNPCQNGGTCIDIVNDYQCQCVSGYSGHYCQTNINECSSNPCENGGSCNDMVNSFSCGCVNGYTGSLCQTNNKSPTNRSPLIIGLSVSFGALVIIVLVTILVKKRQKSNEDYRQLQERHTISW